MAKSIKTPDGVRLVTGSTRKFTVHAIADDSQTEVLYRTDDMGRAIQRASDEFGSRLRTVVVGWKVPNTTTYWRDGALENRIVWDSADRFPIFGLDEDEDEHEDRCTVVVSSGEKCGRPAVSSWTSSMSGETYYECQDHATH